MKKHFFYLCFFVVVMLLSQHLKATQRYSYKISKKREAFKVFDKDTKILMKGSIIQNSFQSGKFYYKNGVLYNGKDSIGYNKGHKIVLNNQEYNVKFSWEQRNISIENCKTKQIICSLTQIVEQGNKLFLEYNNDKDKLKNPESPYSDLFQRILIFKKIQQRIEYMNAMQTTLDLASTNTKNRTKQRLF